MGDRRVIATDLPAVVHSGVEKAIGITHSAVAGYVRRLRRARPAATPAEIVAALEKRYLAAVTGAGAAMGGVAAAPGAGTGLALALSAGETAVFLETTTFFTLAVAEVHALPVDDADNRREVVLTVVLGSGDSMLVKKAGGRAGEQWAKLLADMVPMSSISTINKALCHWFLNQYPRHHRALALGRFLPFGIGAGIGAIGNHALGRMVVSASRRVFGPPPASFCADAVTIVDTARDTLDAVVPGPRGEVPGPRGEVPGPRGEVRDDVAPKPVPEHETVAEPHTAVTGKYRPLFDHLISQGTDRVDLGFADIDAMVTGGLPKSASTTRSWWSNTPSSRQAKAWQAAGFDVLAVDLSSKTVRFGKRRRR